MAKFLRSGKVPQIRKIPALLWFDGLNSTILPFQKDTFTIGLIHECQSTSILGEAGKFMNEGHLGEMFEGGQPGNFGLGQTHLAWPAAAGGATLTFQKDWHGWSLNQLRRAGNWGEGDLERWENFAKLEVWGCYMVKMIIG